MQSSFAARPRALSLALMAGFVPLANAQQYQAVDLGGLGGAFGASAQWVNNNGEVVGMASTPTENVHAFYWHNGVMEDLPTFPEGGDARALCINDNGVIVGSANRPEGRDRAVKWERVGGVWQITELGTLPGGIYSVANRISNNGKIVGYSHQTTGPYHAFLIDGSGPMTDLGALDYPPNLGYSEATGVNDAGTVVGYAYAPLFGPDHGWRWAGGVQTDITPPGQFTFARGTGINTGGTVSGILILPGGASDGFEAAVYTQANGWTEIGVLAGMTESEGLGINDDGVVVGRSFDLALQDFRGFVYANGVMTDLSTGIPGAPSSPIVEALSVNNAGMIVANANPDSGPIALLLTPVGAPCYANCDGSTSEPVLNVLDFNCFLNRFGQGDSYANCDNSTSEPVLNVLDFNCFLNRFTTGCN